MKWSLYPWLACSCLVALGCASAEATPEAAPPCDATCQDQVAMRGLRKAIKLIYNIKLQGKPVGEQSAVSPCPQGGKASVSGNASSDPDQGATLVELDYSFVDCRYVHPDEQPADSYEVTANGSISERGVIAVQPSTTTALIFESASFSLSGSIYDPGIDYRADGCELELSQNGNELSGLWCGRDVGFNL